MTMFCVHLVIDQSPNRASCGIRQARRHGPPITYNITPCLVTLFQPVRRATVLDQSSSLWPHWVQHPIYTPLSYHRQCSSLMFPSHSLPSLCVPSNVACLSWREGEKDQTRQQQKQLLHNKKYTEKKFGNIPVPSQDVTLSLTKLFLGGNN